MLTPSFTILTYLDGEVLALITEEVAWVDCCYLDSVQDPYQWYLEPTTPPTTNTFTPIIVIGGNFKITQSKLTACRQQQEGNNKRKKGVKEKFFPDTIAHHTTITDARLRSLSYYLSPSVT